MRPARVAEASPLARASSAVASASASASRRFASASRESAHAARHGGAASLEELHQPLEPVASLLGAVGGDLGKGDRDYQQWDLVAGAEPQGSLEAPR